MATLLLAGKNRLISESLRSVLKQEEGINVVGIVYTTENFIDIITQIKVDIIIINSELDQQLHSIMQAIKDYQPFAKILFYLARMNDEIIRHLLTVADSILLHDTPPEGVIRTIHNLKQGVYAYSEQVITFIQRQMEDVELNQMVYFQRNLVDEGIFLTAREVDVAYLLAKGYPNYVIAETLELTNGTVKNYVSHLYAKLHINDRHTLIRYLATFLKKDKFIKRYYT